MQTDVITYGIKTALAEEFSRNAMYEDAQRLAKESVAIAEHA
jgi:hypothetical protein